MLDPLRRGERVSYQRLEGESNSLSAPVDLPVAAIVLVEGSTALHPDIATRAMRMRSIGIFGRATMPSTARSTRHTSERISSCRGNDA